MPFSRPFDIIFMKKLLANYVAFLAWHRGSVEEVDGNIVVTSEAPEFSTVFATGRPATLDTIGGLTIRTVPWNQEWEDFLTQHRARKTAEMVFMASDPRDARPLRTTYLVSQVKTPADMDEFTDVQAHAFLGRTNPQFGWWHAFMRSKGRENLGSPFQRFLLARSDGHAVGITIMCITDDLAGLYGVATLEEWRRQGICAALVEAARVEATSRASAALTLQVMQGSEAETVYRKLGFEPVFNVPIFDLHAGQPMPLIEARKSNRY